MRYLNQRNRSILREMISADFKVRYQSSVLGYLWSLLRPLLLFVIMYVVFTYVFDVGKAVPHYPVYLLLGIVLWSFFTETTINGMSAVVGNGDLIRKINIPKYLTVLSVSASALINLGINLVVVFVFCLINGVTPTLSWLLFPLVLLELFIFATAMAFLLAALYVRYRDITYVWEVGMQAAFYATPIIYPLSRVDEQFRQYFFLNPVAQILQDAREILITPQTITVWEVGRPLIVFVPFVLIIVFAVFAYTYFKRQSRWFAENI